VKFDSPSFALGVAFGVLVSIGANCAVEADVARRLAFRCADRCRGTQLWRVDDVRGCVCMQEIKK
jgi:hypothetical protein